MVNNFNTLFTNVVVYNSSSLGQKGSFYISAKQPEIKFDYISVTDSPLILTGYGIDLEDSDVISFSHSNITNGYGPVQFYYYFTYPVKTGIFSYSNMKNITIESVILGIHAFDQNTKNQIKKSNFIENHLISQPAHFYLLCFAGDCRMVNCYFLHNNLMTILCIHHLSILNCCFSEDANELNFFTYKQARYQNSDNSYKFKGTPLPLFI